MTRVQRFAWLLETKWEEAIEQVERLLADSSRSSPETYHMLAITDCGEFIIDDAINGQSNDYIILACFRGFSSYTLLSNIITNLRKDKHEGR